jgi:hypothetical protein
VKLETWAFSCFPWIAGFAVLSMGVALAPVIKSQVGARADADRFANDPPPGTLIDLPDNDVQMRTISGSCRTLLVFCGACSGCSLNDISPERFKNAPFKQIVLLFVSSEEQIPPEFLVSAPNIRVVADPMGEVVSALRAYSAPRFYTLEDGRLKGIWKDAGHWPHRWIGEAEH